MSCLATFIVCIGRCMRRVEFVLVFITLAVSLRAEDYTFNIRFGRDMEKIVHDGSLVISATRSQNAREIVFSITNCAYDLSQEIYDPEIQDAYNFPSAVHLNGLEGTLVGVMDKKIAYSYENDQWVLYNDETESNVVIGPLSGLTDLLVLKTNEWPETILGFAIFPGELSVLSNTPPFELRRRVLDAAGTSGGPYNYEISVVDTNEGKKSYSRTILTNSVMSLDAVLQAETFSESAGNCLVPRR